MRLATSRSKVAEYSCSLEVIVAVLGGKWKPGILFNLLEGPLRFAELRRKLGVTEKVLAQQLRQLEAHEVVVRSATDHVPPRVTYALTPHGRTLRPILERMGAWGEMHLDRLQGQSAEAIRPAGRRSISAHTRGTREG